MQAQESATSLLLTIANESLDAFKADKTREWLEILDHALIENRAEQRKTLELSWKDLAEQLEVAQSVLSKTQSIVGRVAASTNIIHDPSSGLVFSLFNSLDCHSTLLQELLNINIVHRGLFHLNTYLADYRAALTLMEEGNTVEAFRVCNTSTKGEVHGIPSVLLSSKHYQELDQNFLVLSDRIQKKLISAYDMGVNMSRSDGRSVMTIRCELAFPSMTLSLSSILEALSNDILDSSLKSLRNDLIYFFIKPIVVSSCTLSVQGDASAMRLTLEESTQPELLLSNLTTLFSFLCDHLFRHLPTKHRISFPSSLYAPVATSLLAHQLEPRLPSTLLSVPPFLVEAQKYIEFEDWMHKRGCGNRTDIRNWVMGIELHYERKRVEFYVEETRALVKNLRQSDTVKVEGTHPFNQPSKFSELTPSSNDVNASEDEDGWGFGNEEPGNDSDRGNQGNSSIVENQDEPTDAWEWDDGDDDGDNGGRPLSLHTQPGTESVERRSGERILGSVSIEAASDKGVVLTRQNLSAPSRGHLAIENLTVSVSAADLSRLVQSAVAEEIELEASSVFSRLPRRAERTRGASLSQIAPALFDLAQALYPLHGGTDVNSLLLRHNDFSFLAKVARQLRVALDVETNVKSWAEAELGLETAAKECINEAVKREIEIVSYILPQQQFSNVTDNARFEVVKQITRNVLKKVRDFAHECKSIIPSQLYYECLGEVVDGVLSHIVNSIIDMADITESESQRLAELCRILDPVQTLFVDSNGMSQVGTYVLSWFRFSYLAELLVASMADISYLFEEGMLVDYQVSELVKLLRALFADSQLREKAIHRIQQGHPDTVH